MKDKWARAMKRKLRKAKREAEPFAAYSERNAILKEMGFATYALYLRSAQWATVRGLVLARDDAKCCGCGKRANQVHHRQYTRAALEGRDITTLSAICPRCHKGIEFAYDGTNEIKRPLRKANARLRSKVKAKRKKDGGGDPKHIAYREEVNLIKATLKGRARDKALADAIRRRSAQMG